MKHGQKPNLIKKLIAKVIKTSTIQLSCWSLLYAPVSYADADAVFDGLNTGIQMAGQIVQGMQQQQQQQLQQQQMMAQMQSLKVSPVPSKYFPHCPVIPGTTNYPEDACSVPSVGDEAGVNRLQQFKALAIDNESVFEDMLTTGQNSRTPKGIQCLKDSMANTQSTLQDMINNLQAKITQVKAANQRFKQQVTKVKEAMETTRAELYGNPTNELDKNKNLMAEFSPACQEFYGAKGKLESVSSGFTGIRNNLEAPNSSAGKFSNNKSSYVSEVQSQIDAIKKEISANGLSIAGSQESLQSAINSAILESGSSTQFGSMGNILQAKVSNFNRDFKNIQDDLTDVGFDISLSDFDGDFQDKYSNFSKGAYEYFKKEAITSCVNGTDRTIGLGLSTDQILGGLRSKVEGGSSTTLANYRQALKNILDSDAFIEDKMDAIAKLDARFGVGNIYVQIQDADAQGVTMTPYGLYQKQIDTCEARINQDNTFSTEKGQRATENSTYADKIAKAEKAIKKALKLEKKFQNDLATSLYNRVVNCEGIAPKTESCQFSGDGAIADLDVGSPNFCVKNASSCASTINSCYQESETIIKKKQVQMQAHAQNYNSLVSGVIAQQQQVLNQIKAQVIADSEYMKQYFPGASYEFPADLLVEMPEEKMVASLGVALRGGEDLSFDQLEEKLGTLITMLQDQGSKVEDTLGQYIADQESSIQKESDKWSKLKEECNGAIAAYNQAAQKANEAMSQNYNDALSFCQKYTALATNPAAGCGAADDLYEEAMGISSQFMANAGAIKAQAVQYRNMCNEANNEGKNKDDSGEDDEDTELSKYDELQMACDDSGATSESDKEDSNEELVSYIEDQVTDSLPKSDMDSKDVDAVAEFFKDPSKYPSDKITFSKDFKSTTYYKRTLLPIMRGLANVYNDSSAPTPKEGFSFDEETAEEVSKWDELPFCKRYEVNQIAAATNSCVKAEQSDSELESCIKEEGRKPASSGGDDGISAVASAVSAANRSVRTSESGRIGEQMNSVPCMAQQGYNGATGGNIFSGLNQAAQSILGGTNVLGN